MSNCVIVVVVFLLSCIRKGKRDERALNGVYVLPYVSLQHLWQLGQVFKGPGENDILTERRKRRQECNTRKQVHLTFSK